jgi:hypothetical protein
MSKNVEHFPIPLETTGCQVEVHGVSLSRDLADGAYRLGLFLQPLGFPAELTLHLFLTPADALRLRAGLDDVLSVWEARQSEAN